MHRTILAASPPPRPRRQAVLAVAHPDGHLEVYAERHVDVLIARVPVARTREGEVIADDVLELSLPLRYRELLDRRLLRAVGTTRPLTAETAHAALLTRDVLSTLASLGEHGEEAALWTL